MKRRKIIHKFIMDRYDKRLKMEVGIRYLCNWAVEPKWLKTDIANKKICCKNCLRIIKQYKGIDKIERLKVMQNG